MAEDLILKASLDTSEAEAEAQKLKASLAKVDGVSTSPNAGKALATNMNSAKLASDAMFRSLTAMGGPVGRIAGQLKAFSDSARMLRQAAGSTTGVVAGAGAGAGAARLGFTGTAGAVAVGSGLSKTPLLTAWQKLKEATDRLQAAQLLPKGSTIRIGNAELGADRYKRLAKIRQLVRAIQLGDSADAIWKKFNFNVGDAGRSVLKFGRQNSAAGKALAPVIGKFIGLGAAVTAAVAAWTAFASELKASRAGLAAWGRALDETARRRRDQFYSNDRIPVAERRERAANEMEKITREMNLVVGLGGTKQARTFMTASEGFTWRRAVPIIDSGGAREAKESADPEMLAAILKEFKDAGRSQEFWGNKFAALQARSMELEDLIAGFDKDKKAPSKFTPKAPVTDELTRIGGSIGGGIDYQRSMANSLLSIDRAVATIRSAVTTKQTTYI